MRKYLTFAVYIHLTSLHCAVADAEVMKNVMVRFVKPLVKCQREMNLPESVYTDFYNFWNEDYEFTSHPTGCAIVCVAAKQRLIVPGVQSRLDLRNSFDLLQLSGANDETAHKILYFLHKCEQTVSKEDDGCVKAIKSANCFRKEIHNNRWVPHFHEPWM
ncbi:pheromone-binding protein 2-like [Battus philenor]|uniref:pheromone-binding protein 2-like n=1 Tax=Battus philenor TaxID=42288 RepID=UPI0035D0B7FB